MPPRRGPGWTGDIATTAMLLGLLQWQRSSNATTVTITVIGANTIFNTFTIITIIAIITITVIGVRITFNIITIITSSAGKSKELHRYVVQCSPWTRSRFSSTAKPRDFVQKEQKTNSIHGPEAKRTGES